MGYFANIGALNEGEIILSDDRRHLYRVTEGELTEYEKIVAPPGNPDLWEPNQKRGVAVYDSIKQVAYLYDRVKNIWELCDMPHMIAYNRRYIYDSELFSR